MSVSLSQKVAGCAMIMGTRFFIHVVINIIVKDILDLGEVGRKICVISYTNLPSNQKHFWLGPLRRYWTQRVLKLFKEKHQLHKHLGHLKYITIFATVLNLFTSSITIKYHYRKFKIFVKTFCIPTYSPLIIVYHVSNFFSSLNFGYFIRKVKRICDKL